MSDPRQNNKIPLWFTLDIACSQKSKPNNEQYPNYPNHVLKMFAKRMT